MAIFQSEFAVQLVFIMGILNLIIGLLLLFSCRCIPILTRLGKKWMDSPLYQKFYRFHCYLWGILCLSVLVHIIFAIGVFGFPF